MMATSDWLDLRGWIEGLVGWSMDNVHDALPSDDIDATVTISLPTGIWPEDIILGPQSAIVRECSTCRTGSGRSNRRWRDSSQPR